VVSSSQAKYGMFFLRRAWPVLLTLISFIPVAAAISTSAGDPSADQWELATTADDSGHVYVLYAQYRSLADCATCRVPTLTLVTSHDEGEHWEAPRALTPTHSGQVSPQVVVDAADHRVVYATWLENNKQDVMVAKSSDFGQSWSIVLADHGAFDGISASAEHPVIAARGQDVYVGYTRGHSLWAAVSHSGGVAFSSVIVHSGASFAAALSGAAAVDSDGNVFFAWSGYTQNIGGRVHLYITRLVDRGGRWATNLMDTSRVPDGCAAYHCAWGYLGAQISLAADAGGVLYALWTASSALNQPERVYFASSTTHGETWSPKSELSNAPPNAREAFPVIAAGAAGTVRVAWMDSRFSPNWSAFYRTSTNGGATWSDEHQIMSRALASLYAPN
jgi:hypothetical protein